MAQGDPRALDTRIHENGVWRDGACFIWDARARRMSAIFLAFQSQAWRTNGSGDLLYGATGCEAPLYDFSGGAFAPLPIPKRAAEITSAHRAPDGTGAVVVANMTAEAPDLTDWRLLIEAQKTYPLPATHLPPGHRLPAAPPAGALSDEGGLVTLVNAGNLRVEGVAFLSGDAKADWSASFA